MNIKYGGSKIFVDGKIIKTNDTYNGKPFFRKVFYYSNPPKENEIRAANAEIKIARILMEHPNPNIVTYYDVNNDYVDMEELELNKQVNLKEIQETMKKVKDFLQNLGIMYIDWKMDNIGVTKDGTYKLFDFDVSGLIDTKTGEWIIKPLEYWSYNAAIKNGYTTPKQIDDFSFDYNILKKMINHL